jgi:hypothetical protein
MNNSKNYAQIEIRLIIGLMLFVVLGNGLVCVGIKREFYLRKK